MFFTGHKTAPKNYLAYFPKQSFVFDPTTAQECKHIVTHSVGLVKAILYCLKFEIKPTVLVALDPPDLSIEAVQARFPTLPAELKLLYTDFILALTKIDWRAFPIYCMRDSRHQCLDTPCYTEIFYYKEETHYPYQIKHLRDKILARLAKPSLSPV